MDVEGRRLALLLAISLCGCLVDSGAPCGAHLRLDADGACVCLEGSALSDGACVPVVDDGVDDSAGACEAGAGCACTSSRGCPEGELCDSHDSERCVAAPSGLGAPCSGAADCAGTEATFCESFSTRTCVVQGCAARAGICPGDLVCCDYAVIGTSLCVPSDLAPDGGCPAPGQLVMRTSSP